MNFVKISPEEVARAKPSVPELRQRKRTPIYAMLDSVRSRYNVGAMFRTSDAALVSEVILTGITPRPPHRDIDKSAIGATDVVPWRYVKDSVRAARELKRTGVSLVALELTHQSVPYNTFEYQFPICLVIGNELNGISDELLKLCDSAVSIPMLGRANSLNVATAYGIALFEILHNLRPHASR